jgi:ribose/xylose/arabinose/galactoside ABC-type transport system permease subunit
VNAKATLRAPWFGPALALLVLYALFAVLAHDTFPTASVLATMVRQTSGVAVCAVGMTLIIVTGGIDLSVGSVVAVTTVVIASMLRAHHSPLASAAAGVLAAGVCGVVNGSFVGWLKMNPFIVTLGSMSVVRGIAKGLANEQKIDCDPRWLEALLSPVPEGRAWMLFPWGVWISLAIAIVVALLLRTTKAGRHVYAVGSNEATARLCGIRTGLVKASVYVVAGLLAGWAGVMELSKLTMGDPTTSAGLELKVIAAVVIGGGSLTGGEGSIAGSVVGALLMTVIETGCTNVGLPNWVQEIVTGIIIVVAVGLDRFRHAKK